MKLFNLAMVFALLLALGGCKDKTVEPTPTSQITVTNVALGSSVTGDNRVIEPDDEFMPTETIYASIETQGSAPSTALTAMWTYEDGQTVSTDTRTIAPNGTEVTSFHIRKPDGFPEGDYQVKIFLDGDEIETKEFKIDA